MIEYWAVTTEWIYDTGERVQWKEKLEKCDWCGANGKEHDHPHYKHEKGVQARL